jgi:hypothetical protein
MSLSGLSGLSGLSALVGEPFAPSALPGLAGWFDASAASTLSQDAAGTTPAAADSDPVGRWSDRSGQGNHVTQGTAAARPTLKLAVQNGLSVLRLDGVDDWLTKATPAGVGSPTGYTMYFVGARSGSPAFGMMLIGRGSRHELRWDTGGTKPQATYGAGGGSSLSYGSNVSGWHVYEAVQDDAGNSVKLAVDGLSEVSASGVEATAIDVFSVGARGGTNFLAGDVGEVLFWPRPLSGAERGQVLAYLKAKWGTP